MGIDDLFHARPRGSFVEMCMACPIPGVNDSGSAEPSALQTTWPLNSASDILQQSLSKDESPPYAMPISFHMLLLTLR